MKNTGDIIYSGTMPSTLPGFEGINRYWDEKNDIFAAKITTGEYYVTLYGEMITTVLGSCVAACIRDPHKGIGGMNHFMLPDVNHTVSADWKDTPVSAETRYGNVAMERLINTIMSSGGSRKHLEVKLFGGGRMFDMSQDIGEKNIEFVKKYLEAEGFHIKAEDLGGIYPRKVQYYPLTGRVRVKKLMRMHNDTIFRREHQYIEDLRQSRHAGDVEIFNGAEEGNDRS